MIFAFTINLGVEELSSTNFCIEQCTCLRDLGMKLLDCCLASMFTFWNVRNVPHRVDVVLCDGIELIHECCFGLLSVDGSDASYARCIRCKVFLEHL